MTKINNKAIWRIVSHFVTILLMNIKEEISNFFEGEVVDDLESIKKYSRDASLLEVTPQIVCFPKNLNDLKKIVNFVRKNKKNNPKLSLTGRSAGTDMTGGPLTESIVLDFTKYFNKEKVDIENLEAIVEPGVFYRDFENDTLPKHISLPVYPASKQLAALGGMIMNNCAGEKTLRYGQIREFVKEIKMILADGNIYSFRELSREEMNEKMSQNDFEGEIYRKVFDLVTKNIDTIEKFKPKTSKNSSGYAIWRVWDREKDTWNLSHLFIGSQGTLGLFVDAKVRLIRDTPEKGLIALFFKDWDELPDVVNKMLPLSPESMEAFDDTTLKLGIKFMPEIAKKSHQSFLRFALRFLPETLIGIKMLGLPKLIVLVQFAEESKEVLKNKIASAKESLKDFKVNVREPKNGEDSDKYWVMRRESFNLLRQHVHGKKTAPFIDDFAIDPSLMPKFLPKLLKILKDSNIKANIAGHAGNGNYHIIPLMDLSKESERNKIIPVAKQVYELIIEFGGSITAEHNDGIVRTPFVKQMFGEGMYNIFLEIKNIFDEDDMFNPGKKVNGTIDYLKSHIASS